MITLLKAGLAARVDDGVVEAAFRQAMAESPRGTGAMVGLRSAAVSKIAAALGLGEDVYLPGRGNAKRRAFPAATVARAEEILGAALAGAVVVDPAAEAAEREAAEREAAEKKEIEEFRAEFIARSPVTFSHRGYRNTYRCECGHCGEEIASLEGFDCDAAQGGWSPSGPWRGRRWAATLCERCMARLGVDVAARPERAGEFRPEDGALHELEADSERRRRSALRPDDF